ncbi:[LysW]-aminoadipate/[LysW]-glutamate kinase [Stetteria hydrogenophila]
MEPAGFLVVKVGGRIAADEESVARLAGDLASLRREGWRIVLVHGGGDLVTEYSKRLGVEPKFVVSPSGVRSRYTTREELEVYTMVIAGLVNKTLVARLSTAGLSAVGVSGADCGLLTAERRERIVILNKRGRPQVVPGGYTGRITGVNTACLEALTSAADVAVVAPLAIGRGGVLLNVNGDQAAAAIAGALKARALVLLTDVPGVMLDGRVVESIPAGEAEAYAARVGHGMKRKILEAARAVRGGAGFAVIAPGNVDAPVSRALRGGGTVVRG